MGTLPRDAAGRRRARTREAGAAPVAILAVLLMLALAAGVSIRADRLFAEDPPAAARVDAPTRDDEAGSAAEPDDHHDGPALARAAEAGLHRMRVQFSQSLLPSLPSADDVEAIAASAAAALGLGGAAKPTPAPPAPAAGHADDPVEVRDLRDPRAQRDAGKPPPREPPPQRRLTLPPTDRLMRLPPAEGSVTLVGESTVLIRSHGLTVLTDPGFLRRGERARMGWGLTAARRADPALDLDELPPVDVVVLTRLRGDRFDPVSRRRLPRDVPIVAPAPARAELVSMGFSSVHALPAWGSLRVTRGDAVLTLTATPTRTAPALLSALGPASMGTLLEFGSEHWAGPIAYRIWVSGDTAVDEALLAELEPRVAGADLALLHVGGRAPLGLGGSMDAEAGAAAARRLGVRTALPLRLGDYGGTRVPARALASAARHAAGDSSTPRIRVLERGDVHRFAPVERWALADELATVR
jgi:L-ascorbate metabolism protein UlaG (beta-lactamase superfamily)